MDDQHSQARSPKEEDEEREGEEEPAHDKIEEEMMTDNDAGDFENEKPKKMSLKDSIADCVNSCKGSDGCVSACKNVMKPMPTHTVKKRVVRKPSWEKEKETVIKNCMSACSSEACKKSCTDPNNVPAPKPTSDSFAEAVTEELYEVSSHVRVVLCCIVCVWCMCFYAVVGDYAQ
jgi:hypothetical protein